MSLPLWPILLIACSGPEDTAPDAGCILSGSRVDAQGSDSYTYDAHGDVLVWEDYAGLENGTYTYTNTYDADGRVLTAEVDHTGEGIISLLTFEYAFDSRGNVLSSDAEGTRHTLDYYWTSNYVYDADDNLLTEVSEYNPTG